MKNLLVTGYAAHELGIFDQKHQALKYIRKACLKKLIPLIEDGVEWIITPGQYGFDLWTAELAIKLREKQYPHLNVSVLHAFANQDANWNEQKQQYWNKIKSKLDHFDVVSKQDYAGPWQFQARDQILLNKTDGLLLFYDEEAADSKSKYMKEKALKKSSTDDYAIITIFADDIQSAIEEDMLNDIEP